MSAVLLGAAPRADIVALHDHAEQCARCRGALAAIARLRHGEMADLPLDRRVGRFVIERELGRGGMGVVYAATDEVLHRTVAVKLLNRQAARPARALLAEARGMARVDHPNVVSVLEVSTQAGQVYLAMEFVDGPHLGRWLADNRPDWTAIVETFVGAGQGLRAVHDAGLVHRDFKPHNVLVGADGRARVTDFGLVRPAHDTVEHHDNPDLVEADTATASTAIRGTPRYMAPEQIKGGEIDGRADQFSFCASLYEALAGVPPHGAGTLRQRLTAIAREDLAAALPGRTLPGEVAKVLRRGLRNDPSRRYPNMAELCRGLTAATGRRSRLAKLVIASVGVVSALGLGLAMAAPPTRCPTHQKAIAEVLPDDVRTSLQTRAPADALMAAKQYAATWAHARIAACNAGPVRAEVSDLTYDAMMSCLKTRRLALVSLVAQARDDSEVASRLGSVVRGLDSPHECSDAVPRTGNGTDDPQDDEDYSAVAAELTKAAALRRAELIPEARATLDAIQAQTEAGGWPSLHAQFDAVRADVTMAEGDVAMALSAWRDAYAAALVAGGAGRQWREVVLGGVDLHISAGRLDFAEDLLLTQEAVQRRDALPFFELRLLMQRSSLEVAKSDLTATEATLRQVIALAAGHERGLQTHGFACGNLAVVLCKTGRCPDALPWFRRSIASYTELYGPTAPDVLEQRSNLGVVLADARKYDEARVELQAVVDAAASAGLPAQEGQGALRLARVERENGNLDTALKFDQRAASIYAAQLRKGDPRIADSDFRVGRDLLNLQRTNEAITTLQRALKAAHWQADIVDGLAPTVGGELATALTAAGRIEEAVELIASLRQRVEADAAMKGNRYVSGFYGRAAGVYEAAGRFSEMLAAARRADELLQDWSVPTNERAGIAQLIRRAEAGVANETQSQDG